MAVVKTARGRTLFEGGDVAAYQYAERHFPHCANDVSGQSAEDGPVAQVVVVDDEGGQHAFVGGEWEDVNYDLKQRDSDTFTKLESKAGNRRGQRTPKPEGE